MAHVLTIGVLLLAWCDPVWALGDVQASVADGQLRITGDDGPNAIQITPGVGPGAFVVTGLEGTAVNGTLSAMLSDARKMRIETKGGSDRVELLQIDLEEGLFVKLGDEPDVCLLEGDRIRKKAEIRLPGLRLKPDVSTGPAPPRAGRGVRCGDPAAPRSR